MVAYYRHEPPPSCCKSDCCHCDCLPLLLLLHSDEPPTRTVLSWHGQHVEAVRYWVQFSRYGQSVDQEVTALVNVARVVEV